MDLLDFLKGQLGVVINDFLVATCGQGEVPANAKAMCADLVSLSAEPGALDLSGAQVVAFGLGDSHYIYFNEAARLYGEVVRARHGAAMLSDDYDRGDDQYDEKYDEKYASKWEQFAPLLFTKQLLLEPKHVLLPATFADERRMCCQPARASWT